MSYQKQILNLELILAKSAIKTAHWLAAGADVNAKDVEGITALMYAKNAKQTKVLIDAGADVTAEDFWGNIAFTYAKTPEQRKLLSNAMKKVRTETKATFAQKPENTLIKSITTKPSQKLR